MDFQSAMETFAEAWMAANTKGRPDSTEPQREGSVERSGVRPEVEMTSRDMTNHLTNGGSPGRHTPISLVREHEESPRLTSNVNALGFYGTKTVALHVVVESVPLTPLGLDLEQRMGEVAAIGMGLGVGRSGGGAGSLGRGRVEVDSYALIPGYARFSDLLHLTLSRLGLPEEAANAKGLLQLKNWRPLPLDQVPESEDRTVAEVLAEVAPLATLHVRIFSCAKSRTVRDIKDRLLRLLLSQSNHLLMSAGCPLDEGLLTALARGAGDISEDAARQFDAWWAVQMSHLARTHAQTQVLTPTSAHAPHHHVVEKAPEPLHPALHHSAASQFGPQKTRMRTSFDPELELPRLHRWFAENQHPSRLQIQQYVAELNSLESRRGRKPLDVNNVVYWFKNARAAFKRQEFRTINGLKSPPPEETSVSDVEENVDYNHHAPHPNLHNPASPHSTAPTPTSHAQDVEVTIKKEEEENRASGVCSSTGSSGGGSGRAEETGGLSGRTGGEGTGESGGGSGGGVGGGGGGGSGGVGVDRVGEGRRETSTCGGDVGADSQIRSLQSCSDVGGGGGGGGLGDQGGPDSDVEMSDDEDTRSRDSGAQLEMKGSTSPVVSPGSLTLSSYAGLPGLGHPGGVERLHYPVVPGSLLQHSMMYMAHYMPQVPPFSGGLGGGVPEERRKRNRTFIDPVTEVPRLEQWFTINTHPSHNLILKYTEELNRMPYRQKFPKLEPKNVQFWFKNRRAKCKRLRVSM